MKVKQEPAFDAEAFLRSAGAGKTLVTYQAAIDRRRRVVRRRAVERPSLAGIESSQGFSLGNKHRIIA
jgi:hypothetical protein